MAMNRRKFLGLVPTVPLVAKAKVSEAAVEKACVDVMTARDSRGVPTFGLAPVKREGGSHPYDHTLETAKELWPGIKELYEARDRMHRDANLRLRYFVDRDADG